MGKKKNAVKTRYTKTELNEFEKLIDDKLVEAKQQLQFYLTQLSNMADNPDNKVKKAVPHATLSMEAKQSK